MTLRTDARKVAVLVLASWFAILGCNGLTSPDIDADRDVLPRMTVTATTTTHR